MSHQPSGVLTVDELISPLPIDLNVTLSKSVSIQIEDEGEPLPPCTMVLQGDLQNLSMPRILEAPSPRGDGVQIRIEQTPPMAMLKPSTPTNVSKTMSQPATGPPGTPGISHGQSPPQLTKEWGEKITGSPSNPAFPPSYAKVATDGAKKSEAQANKTAASANKTTARARLWKCTKCQKRCYTEKGLHSHHASCSGKKGSSDMREQDANTARHGNSTVPKNRDKDTERDKKDQLQPVRSTYCRHCDRSIFLSSTLEDHYRRKHSRELSPQGPPATEDIPEPLKKTGTRGPLTVQPSTSKKTRGPEHTPPLKTTAPPGNKIKKTKIPPPAHSTVAIQASTNRIGHNKKNKKYICDFCERRLATAGALEDHARCVHEVVPEMTFAFEDDGEPADFTQRSAARTHQRQLTVNYSCKRCSASTPTSFLSEERLDKHMAQCHAQPNDVVDAAACSDVPAYHVLCPDGLRPDAATRDQPAQVADGQQAGPSRDPDPPQPTSHGVTPIANAQPINTDALCCEVCGKVAKTHKALKYHQLRMHGIPVLKPHALRSNNKPEEKPVNDDQQESVPPPPSPDALPLITSQAVTTAAAAPGAALLGETLRFTFPLPRVVACPIHNCGHTFCTKSWYTTTNSAKKHLRMYHRLFNRTTQYWCSVCDRNITTKPFSHPCLKATGMMLKKVGQNAWPCEECGESFTNKSG
ncbi:hypothetical protein TNCV_2504141 [Trichonephila clavipes]|nr:hypothetical protein TNCV_2504141 [Trichonephila clavipes]